MARLVCSTVAYSLGSYYIIKRKHNQDYRASVVVRVIKDRTLGRRARSENSRLCPSSVIHKWRPHVVPTPHQGKRVEQRRIRLFWET